MVFIDDPLIHPENLGTLKKCMEILEYQIRMAEALEHARIRLSRTTTLDANTLTKCRVFADYVNKLNTTSNFCSEVSKLSWNELVFAMISFEERRLKMVVDLFKASDIKKYIEKQNINCLDRSEILARIKYTLKGREESRFGNMYSDIVRAHSTQSDIAMYEDPQPVTAAEEHNAFKLLGVRREPLKRLFPEHIANTARLMTVESRYPRLNRGDGFISFDIESDHGHITAFDPFRDGDNPVVNIPEAFGHTIATAIDRCDLRSWEQRKGYMNTTNCVKMKVIYRINLRICYDSTIANILHSERVD